MSSAEDNAELPGPKRKQSSEALGAKKPKKHKKNKKKHKKPNEVQEPEKPKEVNTLSKPGGNWP